MTCAAAANGGSPTPTSAAKLRRPRPGSRRRVCGGGRRYSCSCRCRPISTWRCSRFSGSAPSRCCSIQGPAGRISNSAAPGGDPTVCSPCRGRTCCSCDRRRYGGFRCRWWRVAGFPARAAGRRDVVANTRIRGPRWRRSPRLWLPSRVAPPVCRRRRCGLTASCWPSIGWWRATVR